MKRRLMLLLLVAVLASGAFAANGVLDDFEGLAAPYDPLGNGWSTDKTWSTWGVQAGEGEGPSQGCVWDNGSNWYEIVTEEGIPAPAAEGDWVSVEARFKFTFGPNGSPKVNGYGWNFGFETEADGTGKGVEMLSSRRQDAIMGAATTGDAGWQFYGWSNISGWGLSGTTDATSDWVTQRITITKVAAGYDVLAQFIANDGVTVLVEKLSAGETLPTMAAAPVWYGKMATQNTIAYTDITKIVMDNFVLKNSKYTEDPVAHTPIPDDSYDEIDSQALTEVAWADPLTNSDPEGDPNLVSVDQYDITYIILDNDAVTDDEPNWMNGTTVTDVTSPFTNTDIQNITYEQTMFWRVDNTVTWDSNEITGTDSFQQDFVGNEWMLVTKPAYIAPEVTASGVITTVDLSPAALSATVTGSNPITTVAWTLLSDDVDFPAGSDAAIQNEVTSGNAPTAELATSVAGLYKVLIEVTDDQGGTDSTLIGINVYADACAAKKAAPSGWAANYFDVNDDCVVDVVDFADLAMNYLTDTSMMAQENEDYNSSYIPQSIVEARIEAESVDPNEVSDAPLTDEVGIRILTQEGPIANDSFLGWSGNGAYCDYQVTVNAAVYDIWISCATPYDGRMLSFGDGTTADLYGSVDIPNTGNWNTFVVPEYVGALDFTGVTPGDITLRITWTEGSNLDWFTLVQQP